MDVELDVGRSRVRAYIHNHYQEYAIGKLISLDVNAVPMDRHSDFINFWLRTHPLVPTAVYLALVRTTKQVVTLVVYYGDGDISVVQYWEDPSY